MEYSLPIKGERRISYLVQTSVLLVMALRQSCRMAPRQRNDHTRKGIIGVMSPPTYRPCIANNIESGHR